MTTTTYQPKNKVRLVTAASLFDGHDAAINIMRRIMQASGAEIIHLGHNRSVLEIVDCAIQEDVQGIAITSYQGGHVEFFKYMYDLLQEKGAGHIKIFGGGGGTILPSEIAELQAYGITRIYSPDDGREMGLQGMINDVLMSSDFPVGEHLNGEIKQLAKRDAHAIGRVISAAENFPADNKTVLQNIPKPTKNTPVLGITGTGGAGKSSLVDELVRRFLMDFTDKTIAIVSVDPSKRKTGGALLGDRIRMNAINNPRVFMRSLATRQSNLALSKHVQSAIDILKAAEFDLIILETSGIGQSDTEIIDHSDVSLYVMTPEYGAATQLEKIDMLDFADIIALNKFDKRGALDALRDVKKQYQRNHNLWDIDPEQMPVFGTMASQFNDPGMNALYVTVIHKINEKCKTDLPTKMQLTSEVSQKIYIIPPDRTRYLSEISETIRNYNQHTDAQAKIAELAQAYQIIQQHEGSQFGEGKGETALRRLDADAQMLLENWDKTIANYKSDEFVYQVRGKDIKVKTTSKTLAGTAVPKVAVPRFTAWADRLRWAMQENFPGEFPYTAGVFPFKRTGEDPTRMFAGEGSPERTNRRFHYVSLGMPANRLSTAFDSVTLYGEDPHLRLDIYGKIGNSGVSVCCLDDAKKLYSGFRLTDPRTSVSMTINGPAATICAFFLNAAIDQECEVYIKANGMEDEIYKRILEIYANQYFDAAFNQLEQDDDLYKQTYEALGLTEKEFEEQECVYHKCIVEINNGIASVHLVPAPNNKSRHFEDFKTFITKEGIAKELFTPTDLKDWKGIQIPTILSLKLPKYQGELPESSDGLGLMLLGVTGDQVLPNDIYNSIKIDALKKVRGTVQADILKEDQAQNTCIFSTEFALRLMGDVQAYFIQNNIQNFYSVSISGYHIAEAGANPITQLAFTLANGFTFVEYYRSRGMNIDDFAPNLSFFFSNGVDAEYAVIGRVARRIWAKAMKLKYKANDRSQKLKYHIQTSGRSLHAQEIAFNDIRTTLQALYAIYDNCNSLHTNAYDEAITTPTEESVRRAMAIQLIINHELGLAKNENPMQGSFITEELTDLVEEAVLMEFDRITERGGVLGAMETMYQRGKIQEESLVYEMQKHTGELPLIGVNTFLSKDGSPTIIPSEVIRATEAEKQDQIATVDTLTSLNPTLTAQILQDLQQKAIRHENLFEGLMEAVKHCSLGQITNALYAVGGQYRRNM